MDLYADDLADYIYQENDVDKKRALLLEVEAEIKKLMGEQEKGSLDLRHIGAVQIEKMFDRQLLTVGEIVAEWKSLLLSLWKQNPELKILFTVSPIRHWKDGAHGNQLSKATLLLAINALQKEFPEHTAYFPAYEIMMDELREYRFYADDMLHPSTTAIEYIWERFTGSMLSPDSLSILKEWKDIQKAINHKPFQPESEAYKRFISQTLLKMERLNEKFPYFDMTNEVEMIKKKF